MKRFLAILVFALVACMLFAEVSIRDVISDLPDELVGTFLSGEVLNYYSREGNRVPDLAFDGTKAKTKAEADYANEDAFTSALSCFVPYPESWKDMSFEEKKLGVINTLLKISTIKGITYISYSAGNKPKVLFEDAYALTEKGKKGMDPAFTFAPENYTYHLKAHLKDNIFGGNTYAVDYEIEGNEIFMKMTNTTDMKIVLFKAVSKNELNMCIDVVLTEEGVGLYGMATVFGRETEVKTPITTVHLPSAFMRRITALKDWFVQEFK